MNAAFAEDKKPNELHISHICKDSSPACTVLLGRQVVIGHVRFKMKL
jgi:hypothetical protein